MNFPLPRGVAAAVPTIGMTAEQQTALDLIEAHIIAGKPEPFVLTGLAGCGKTVTLAAAARANAAKVCAPTAKAAEVLASRLGRPVSTVHNILYTLKEVVQDARGRQQPKFRVADAAPALHRKVIFLDECSMVGVRMGRDLLNTGAIIIASGDFGQLPPVAEDPFFTVSTYELTKIIRQAADSAIIRQAHRVRAGDRYASDGDDFRVVQALTDEILDRADVALCWRNTTKDKLNSRIRAIRGFAGDLPQAGETVLALKNAHRYGIANGSTFTLLDSMTTATENVRLRTAAGATKIVPNVQFLADSAGHQDHEATSSICFGYALTVHKSQGSEWKSVALVDEFARHPDKAEERRRWLYTAITRAAEHITTAPGGGR